MDTNEVIQTLKNLHPNSYVTHGRYQKETYGDSYYVVVNESDGLYFYVKRHSKIDLLHHLSWMDVPEELYLRSRKKDNTYQGASKVIFTIFIGNPDGESIVALLEQKRKIHQLRKSLFRKIPGYRSKKIWKMAVASLFYLFALFIIFIALATDDIDNKNENKKSIAQSVSSEKIKKNTLSSDEETAKKKRAQEKAQAEADKKKKIAQEKAQAEADKKKKIAQEKAQAEADKKKKIAQEKAQAEADKKKKIAQEKAQAEADKKKKIAQEKAQAEADKKKKIAQEKAQAEADKKKKIAQEKAQAEADKKKKIAQEKAQAEANKKKKIAQEKAQAEANKKKKIAQEKAQAEANRKKATKTVKTNFSNCTELNKKYPDGVSKTHPAYQAKMDRDKDNFACERN